MLAAPLRSSVAPPALPMIRVRDETGNVRRLLFGWRPSYGEALDLPE